MLVNLLRNVRDMEAPVNHRSRLCWKDPLEIFNAADISCAKRGAWAVKTNN